MAKPNTVTSTGSIDTSVSTGPGDATGDFPATDRGRTVEDPRVRPGVRSVKAEYEALVRAAAPGARLEHVLSVTLANDVVRVEYVDRTQVSEFEPDPVRTAIAKVK